MPSEVEAPPSLEAGDPSTALGMTPMACPNCSSEKIRRGGMAIWLVYVTLIALAIPATLIFHLNAAIVAAIMIAVIVIAHLVFDMRVCLDCGHQWRA